jgi:hypothetical protein
MSARRLVEFNVTATALEIRRSPDPEDVAELLELGDFSDAIEWHLCNGWHIIPPEEVGALTDGLLLAEDVEFQQDGKIVGIGPLFWDNQYETRDMLEQLKRGETVSLVRRD